MDRLSTSSLLSSEDSSINSSVADFGRSFVHESVENPVNGLRQICNQTKLVNLPEFDIVKDTKPSLSSEAGAIAGNVALFSALSAGGNRVMGNLGGDGFRGSVLRAGIIGGVMDGALKPTLENSPTFMQDRIKGTMIGAATFAGMAAAGAGLDKTGYFAVPEARSLQGSIAYGAISGVGGGLAHAQAEAMFKEGHLLAAPQAYLKDSLSMGAFGGAFGAVGYGTERLSATLNKRIVEMKSDDASVRIKLDRNGEVAQVETILPSVNTPNTEVKVTNSKMTDGNWSSTAKARFEGDKMFWVEANPYNISQANRLPSGELRLLETTGQVRAFSPNGEYSKYPLGQKLTGEKFDFVDKYGDRTVVADLHLNKFDHEGRLREVNDWNNKKSLNYFTYDKNGDVKTFSVWREGGNQV
ncbi:MAG: hypothetical protein K2X81_24225, partial [Candidatus Obscuribacterales bacterium]|nr:hypothetical protein [Candidatus Obscuribacterales bacterium]